MTNEVINALKNSIHFIFASKGGCGKTYITALLAQYLLYIGVELKGFDTDQENPDFFAYKALPVRFVDVMEGNTIINEKKFDDFMASLLSEDGVFVVDNGANSFTPLMGYLVENHGIEMLRDSGKKVYLHGIIGGGDNYNSTITGFNDLVSNSDAPVILWLNEHFGELINEIGIPFFETAEFKQHSKRLCGAIMLNKRNPKTFGEDIKKMTKARLTFDEVFSSANFGVMERQRLRLVAKEAFEQLAKIKF
jgi:hypothetical protein